MHILRASIKGKIFVSSSKCVHKVVLCDQNVTKMCEGLVRRKKWLIVSEWLFAQLSFGLGGGYVEGKSFQRLA